MRILWSSNAPWAATGYGKQTALWVPQIAALGHDVALCAFYGLLGAPITWNGIPVYPGSTVDDWALDILPGHYGHFGADLVIALMDVWAPKPYNFAEQGMRAAVWMPVDCSPVSKPDREALTACGATPIAMSRFGERQLAEAGFEPLYCPHAIDTGVFRPPVDRAALRQQMGVDDRFVVGINAANRDKHRKGFPEQFAAFARFRKKHTDALLLVHAEAEREPLGLDLRALAEHHGITDAVRFADQYEYVAGFTSDEAMATWYGCLDLFSGCAWGEGFGIPLIEAQACGVPVVTTRAASMTELCGGGWLVEGEPYWHWGYRAEWTKPSIAGIVRAYEKAYTLAGRKRAQAREFSLRYSVKRVLDEHMAPVLASLSSR